MIVRSLCTERIYFNILATFDNNCSLAAHYIYYISYFCMDLFDIIHFMDMLTPSLLGSYSFKN